MKRSNDVGVAVDRLALEGDGVGRLGGKAVFVPYAAPGDYIRGRLVEDRKSYSRLRPESISKKGPSRIEAPCPHYFNMGSGRPACGGCDWQHIDPAAQRSAKESLLNETLQKIGGFPRPPVEPIRYDPSPFRYRNKVQIPFGRRAKNVVAGFYARGSHDIVEFEDCLVQPTATVELVHFVKSFAVRRGWPIYEEDRNGGWLRHVLIRINDKGDILLTLVTSDPRFPLKDEFVARCRAAFPSVRGIHQNVQPARTHVVLGFRWARIWGASHIEEELGGMSFKFSPGSFFQVNTAAARILYQTVFEELRLGPGTVLLDLFCGVGTMTLIGSRRAKWAIGVDEVDRAVRDASANATRNGIANVEFHRGQAERAIHDRRISWIFHHSLQTAVILDPPRKGCDDSLLSALLRYGPGQILYVSCNPATLARDVKRLSGRYQLTKIIPVDMFPQTSHIESVSNLTRRAR